MRRGSLTAFPAQRSSQVLAHVEERCGGPRSCPFCRAEQEGRSLEGKIEQLLEESIALTEERRANP
jgi:hypothetical protein